MLRHDAFMIRYAIDARLRHAAMRRAALLAIERRLRLRCCHCASQPLRLLTLFTYAMPIRFSLPFHASMPCQHADAAIDYSISVPLIASPHFAAFHASSVVAQLA